jgi:O-antigen ligase
MKKLLYISFNNFYLCIFYIFTSFSSVTALKLIPGIGILPKIALLWGIVISLKNLYSIFKRKPYSIEWFLLLLLFIPLVFDLSVYYNTENIKIWFVNLVLLTAIFFVNKEKTKATLEKELSIISNIYIALTFIFSSISFVLIALNKTIFVDSFVPDGKNGFFQNENSLGISAALSLVISIYLILSITSKKLKTLYLINLLIQLSIVLMSPARSAFFVFVALIGVLILIKLKKTILRIIFLATSCLGTIYACTFQEELLNRITTNRDAMWSSASLVIKDNFLLGVGNSNLVQKVIDARSVYIPEGIHSGGLHNIYIEVFTSNGVFAFIALIAFILISLYSILTRITKLNSKENIRFYLIFSLIVSILMINLFESNLLYIISFISMIFWIYLGYTLSIIEAEKRDEL